MAVKRGTDHRGNLVYDLKEAIKLPKAVAATEDYDPGTVFEQLTVPGQALTIKELMERYEKGRPIPEL
jgi:hypothetical protein